MLRIKPKIIHFTATNMLKEHIGEEVTTYGSFQERVYKDFDRNILHSPSSSDVPIIQAIWLNSQYGHMHNDKFGGLIIGEAIPAFFKKFGFLSNAELRKKMAVCHNFLLKSESGTEKPYVVISEEAELNNLVLEEMP